MYNSRKLVFIFKLFLFAIFASFIYVILICFITEYTSDHFHKNVKYIKGSYGHTFTRLNEVKRTKNIDILFLGSSHAYRGFDTRIFNKEGYSSFNLGSSSQTPLQTMILLNRYIENLNPKLIIYEVYPETFSIDGVESSLDIISNDINDKESLILFFQTKNIKVLNTLIFGLYKDIFYNNSNYFENRKKGEDYYISGGFVQSNFKQFKNVKYKEKQAWKLKKRQFNNFSKNIEIIKNKHIKLLLVQAPITVAKYQTYTNNDEFDIKMESFGDYINFNNNSCLNDSLHFYDNNHLNQAGVEIFNKELIRKLNFLQIKL